MSFENSIEQNKLQESQQSAQMLLPSQSDYQNFYKTNIPGKSEPAFLDFGNENIYGEHSVKIVQEFQTPGLPTLVPTPEQLGITPETTRQLAIVTEHLLKVWSTDKPLAANRESVMASITDANTHAWTYAKAAFPQLADVSENLMQAYVRNEIGNYDRFDLKDDIDAATGKLTSTPLRAAEQATLGISQISPKGVREFEQKYPQFQQFLASKGYTGSGHEIAALLDVTCAPMIVAAKTASIVDDLKAHGIKTPSQEQLAYAYNPDVFSFSDGHGGKNYSSLYQAQIKFMQLLHPDLKKEYYATSTEITNNSAHVHNVMSAFR